MPTNQSIQTAFPSSLIFTWHFTTSPSRENLSVFFLQNREYKVYNYICLKLKFKAGGKRTVVQLRSETLIRSISPSRSLPLSLSPHLTLFHPPPISLSSLSSLSTLSLVESNGWINIWSIVKSGIGTEDWDQMLQWDRLAPVDPWW